MHISVRATCINTPKLSHHHHQHHHHFLIICTAFVPCNFIENSQVKRKREIERGMMANDDGKKYHYIKYSNIQIQIDDIVATTTGKCDYFPWRCCVASIIWSFLYGEQHNCQCHGTRQIHQLMENDSDIEFNMIMWFKTFTEPRWPAWPKEIWKKRRKNKRPRRNNNRTNENYKQGPTVCL